MKKLTETDFLEAANILNVEQAVIKAVCEFEAPMGGFFSDGRTTILFEAHIFSKETNKKYNNSHPDISSSTWNLKLYKVGVKEYDRLEKAAALDTKAAYRSASWGKFQIMGFNHSVCGYSTVQKFVDDMHKSEREHLMAFINFVKNNPTMHKALRELNWAGFAKAYNGPAYAENKYDTKLRDAYL